MAENRVVADQPLPSEGQESVHDRIVACYGQGVFAPVVADILARAEHAQTKYKLARVGLYTFNGRSAMLDLYQELLDAVAYATQVEMELDALDERWPLPLDVDQRLLRLAAVVRRWLVEKGELGEEGKAA